MRPGSLNLLLGMTLCLGFTLACSLGGENRNQAGGNSQPGATPAAKQAPEKGARKLDSYTLRGLTFSYYLIPAGRSRDELIRTAQEIHRGEPDAQLVLVDDEAGVQEYIAYAKAISQGNSEAKMPREWADKHIVANLQKLMSGKWRLYEGYGYKEIADLE